MTRLPRSIWLPVLGLSLLVFGWRLHTVPLTNWDEGIYANVNLELFRSHDWTKLTYFGADFLEKPPLQFWATFPLFGIFGPTELAVRLWSALAGVGVALLICLWSWQATQQRLVAWLAPAIFVLGRFALIHAFRTGDLDGLLTLFIALAMYGYWRSWTAPRWIVVWGAATAAAVMTKSFAGLIPLLAVAVDIVVSRGWRKVGWGNLGFAVATFLLLAAPWHIVETMRFGRTFWDSYLGLHLIERTTESLFTTTPWHYYLGVVQDRLFPFSYVLPLALWTVLPRPRYEQRAFVRVLFTWVLVVLVLFTIIQTRREWYILPMYPAAAMLVGLAATRWWRERQSRGFIVLFGLSIAAAFGHLLTDGHFRLLLDQVPVLRLLDAPWWRSQPGQAVFGVGAVGVVVALANAIPRRWPYWQRLFIVTGSTFAILAAAWTVLYIRALPSSLPLKTIAARVEQARVQQLSLIGTRLKKQPAGYFYILRLDTHSAEYPPGTPPYTPLVLTTNEPKNYPLNTEGEKLVEIPPLLLIDLR